MLLSDLRDDLLAEPGAIDHARRHKIDIDIVLDSVVPYVDNVMPNILIDNVPTFIKDEFTALVAF